MYDYPVAYSFPAAGAGVPADAAAGASVQLIPMIPMIPMPLVLLMMLPCFWSCRCPAAAVRAVPCARACACVVLPVLLDNDMSSPPRNTQAGTREPPGGAGVGRGGWHGVAHAWDSYIYLNLYTSFHIAFLIIGK